MKGAIIHLSRGVASQTDNPPQQATLAPDGTYTALNGNT